MVGLQTVVAALDLSPASEPALACAADVAGRTGAALHLLHADVLFRSSGDGAPPDLAPDAVLRLRVERFAAEALGLGSAEMDGHAPTVAVVRDLTAQAAVLRYAADVRADLLVMGTHGRGGLARVLLGSVAEACVAAAPCPVLTVPQRAAGAAPSPEAPVLVPIDFSERSRAALVAGRALAALFGAPVELVHCVRDTSPYPALSPALFPLGDVDRDEGRAVEDRLAQFAASVPGGGLHPAHALVGPPTRVIPALAADRGAGAIVMGTHGRTIVAHALAGSVAEVAARRSPCPVLILKADEVLGRRAPLPVPSLLSSPPPPQPFA